MYDIEVREEEYEFYTSLNKSNNNKIKKDEKNQIKCSGITTKWTKLWTNNNKQVLY